MFKKLISNTIAFVLTAIYYAIREYSTGFRAIYSFYGSVVSGLYISGILLYSFIL